MPVNTKALKEYQKQMITPATLRRALLDACGQLTDREVFLSPAYHTQLNSLSRYIVGRTGRNDIAVAARVIWDDGEDAPTAYTDNKKAVLNAAYPNVQKLPRRAERHYCVMGMACHEFAHCLFTDFTLLEKQYDAFMAGKLYPHMPAETPKNAYGLKGIQEFMDKGKRSRKAVWGIYNSLDNSIEDGYVERSIVQLFPGDTKKSLRILNNAFFGGNFMDFIKERVKKDPSYLSRTWSIFENALLTLLKTGAVDIDPAYSEYMKDIHGRIADLAPRIMREVENSYALSRKELALDIILDNWDLIESEVEYEYSRMSEVEKALSELSDEELDEILNEIIKQIIEGAGADHQDHEDSNGGIPIKVFIELPSPSQKSGDGSGGSGGETGEEDGKDSGSDQDGSSSSQSDADSDSDNNGTGDDGEGKDGGQNGNGEDGDVGNGEAGESKSGADSSKQPGGGKPERGTASSVNQGESVTIRIVPENEASESDDSFRKALSGVETGLAEQTAREKVEKSLQDTLQSNANASATNDAWNINISRRAVIPQSGVSRYHYIWPKISPISKTLKRELLKILRERRQGSKQTGLIHGRRLDTRSLYRTDEKYFAKNRMPNDRPTVATALLIDQSGSMASMARDGSNQNLFANKIEAAGNAALLLYDFCAELDFPIMVAGHTTEGRNIVSIDVMASFQKKDKEDRYRICSAGAYGGNRDGTALNYMLSELKKRPEEIKLLFIISDGLPSEYGRNEDGVLHLREVLNDADKSGVLTFAAALNEDFDSIKGIYGDNMFEITDLARMPRTLLNVMKQFVK